MSSFSSGIAVVGIKNMYEESSKSQLAKRFGMPVEVREISLEKYFWDTHVCFYIAVCSESNSLRTIVLDGIESKLNYVLETLNDPYIGWECNDPDDYKEFFDHFMRSNRIDYCEFSSKTMSMEQLKLPDANDLEIYYTQFISDNPAFKKALLDDWIAKYLVIQESAKSDKPVYVDTDDIYLKVNETD